MNKSTVKKRKLSILKRTFGQSFPSSKIVMLCGLIGLVSLFLPWIVHVGRGYWNAPLQTLYESGVDMLIVSWEARALYGREPRFVLALLVLGCSLCLFTPVLTRKPSKRSARAPLYVFYVSLVMLAVLDVSFWIEVPRGYIPEAQWSINHGVGMTLASAVAIGLSIGALMAWRERHPNLSSWSSLLVGMSSGIFLLFSFFNIDWIVLFRTGVSGFQIAYRYFAYFPRSSRYLLSLVLYLVPVIAMLTIISPFLTTRQNLKLDQGRVIRASSGLALLVICYLISTAASEVIVAQGFWSTIAIGIFLIVSETLLFVAQRSLHPKQSSVT